MDLVTNGHVERGVLNAFVVPNYDPPQYEREQLATSGIITRVRNQASYNYDRDDIAESSIRRAISKLTKNELIEEIRIEHVDNTRYGGGDKRDHSREKFWQLTSAGSLEVLLLQQAFNDALVDLYRRFGSGDWNHAPGERLGWEYLRKLNPPEVREYLYSIEYSELQAIAGETTVAANQSSEEMIEQLCEKAGKHSHPLPGGGDL